MTDIDRGPYRTLDGLRGVAALVVVSRHAQGLVPDAFPESFLAVDFFFLLSGFVVALAYEQRLLNGQSLTAFMTTRLIRLYPLYLLGLGLGLLARLASPENLDAQFLVQAVVIGLLMLPAVPPLPMGSSTLDGPTWTLAPELLANLLYAATVRRLRPGVLCLIVALGGVGLAASEAAYGSLDGGWSVDRFPLLAARLGFSFFLGVLAYRVRPRRRVGAGVAWSALALLALALTISVPAAWRAGYELGAVMLLFPAVLQLAIRYEPGPIGGRMCELLGLTSYALYVLHQPLSRLTLWALQGSGARNIPEAVAAPVFLALLVLVSAYADRLYDRPIRRWLTGLRAPVRRRLTLPSGARLEG